MALNRRVRFTVEYEVNLDLFPGWGYSPEDWHALAISENSGVMLQKHYKPTAKVVDSTVIPPKDQN